MANDDLGRTVEERLEAGASLETLAAQINAEHRAFLVSLKTTAEYGIRAGELLTEAKKQCPHGTWLDWLEANFDGAPRTAQEYMRLYDRRDEVRANTRGSAHLSISGALKEIATPKPERRIAVEAVAEAEGIDFESARKEHRHEVDAVRNAVEHESERREEKGKTFSDEERADYAKRLVESKMRSREREAREREARRTQHSLMFREVDNALRQARQKVKFALDRVREDIEFTEEEVELLEAEYQAVQAMLGLFGAALSGDSGTDWNAALFELEQRRQWGDALGGEDEEEGEEDG
jgi:hypothetical protein